MGYKSEHTTGSHHCKYDSKRTILYIITRLKEFDKFKEYMDSAKVSTQTAITSIGTDINIKKLADYMTCLDQPLVGQIGNPPSQKKPMKVFKPLSLAIFPTLIDGSTPIALIFSFFSGFNNTPSLEPISTTNLYF